MRKALAEFPEDMLLYGYDGSDNEPGITVYHHKPDPESGEEPYEDAPDGKVCIDLS